jgi:hypothetical protein
VEALIAGWVAGYAMAMASTLALTFLAIRSRESRALKRWVDSEVSTALLAVPIFLGAMLGWTMAGLILGAVYEVGDLGSRADFLGSPSGPFLLGVVALAWLPLPPLLIFWRRYWWLWCGMSGAFMGLFGWLMPLLAER